MTTTRDELWSGMAFVKDWLEEKQEPHHLSAGDEAMVLAAHAVRLAAFWNCVKATNEQEYVEVLMAAFKLNNAEQFANVLCEVVTPDCGSALEIMKAFMLRVAA